MTVRTSLDKNGATMFTVSHRTANSSRAGSMLDVWARAGFGGADSGLGGRVGRRDNQPNKSICCTSGTRGGFGSVGGGC
jgi:hypothetical protein